MSFTLIFWIKPKIMDHLTFLGYSLKKVFLKKTIIEEQIIKSVDEPYPDWIEIKPTIIPNAGLGVFTNIPIKAGTYIGNYKGKITKEYPKRDTNLAEIPGINSYVFFSRKFILWGEQFYVDAFDHSESNWTRYLNCCTCKENDNVNAIDIGSGKIIFYTSRDVRIGEELCFYYGTEYAKGLGIEYDPYNY